MRSLSADEHDAALCSGIAVLVLRVAESPACQTFQPELDKFVAQHPDCPVWTVEAMEQRDLAEKHHLRALPTVLIYRDGFPFRRFAGSLSADDLVEEVDELREADFQEEYNDWMIETGEAGSRVASAPRS
jgi:thioredoxin-like negative regulator of GroEL